MIGGCWDRLGMNAVNAKKIGVAAILGSSMMWALEPVLAKMAYRGSDFLQTAGMRAAVTCAVACCYGLITNRMSLKISKRELPKLVYIAIAGTIAADTLYFYALTRIPVINAVLIGHMQPIFIVLIGFFVFRENLSRFDYLGIGVMIVSGLMVSTRTVENLMSLRPGQAGDLYVLAATVLWATTAIVMKKYLAGMNSGVITFYRFAIASTVFAVYLGARGGEMTLNGYQVAVGFVTATGTILYYEALKRIKAAQVGALELSTPLFAAVLVMFMPTETVTAMQFAGIGLLLCGVYLLSRDEKPVVTFIGD